MVAGTARKPEARRAQEPRESVRDRILVAAMAVARESGASRLSLHAIARRAGVSKGGLLYHFPKKDALMRALVERHLAEIEAATIAATNAPGRPNAVADAFIRAYRAKLACEPAAATALAPLLTGQIEPGNVAVVVSGGNVSPATDAAILAGA